MPSSLFLFTFVLDELIDGCATTLTSIKQSLWYALFEGNSDSQSPASLVSFVTDCQKFRIENAKLMWSSTKGAWRRRRGLAIWFSAMKTLGHGHRIGLKNNAYLNVEFSVRGRRGERNIASNRWQCVVRGDLDFASFRTVSGRVISARDLLGWWARREDRWDSSVWRRTFTSAKNIHDLMIYDEWQTDRLPTEVIDSADE